MGKNLINLDRFLNIQDRDVVYYLGYLWADGYIRKYSTSIDIVYDDFRQIKNILDNVAIFSYKNRNRKNRKEQTSITMSNKKFCDFLKEFDYDKKSFLSPDKIIEKIPLELRKYFYLGIIDGDGCFYSKNFTIQFSITSSYNQDWGYLITLFEELDIKKYNIIKKKNNKSGYSQVRIVNGCDIKKIGDYIYNDDFFGLKRKYESYLKLNEIYLNNKFNKRKKVLLNIDRNEFRDMLNNKISYLEICKYFDITIYTFYKIKKEIWQKK